MPPFTSKPIYIGDQQVGPTAPPFIIAEMSGNHNQSLDRALAIVDAAADAGATALKLQTFTADSMTLDCSHGEFRVVDPTNLWHGETLYNLYEKAHTPWEWHQPIYKRCEERNLICFSTPFDAQGVEFLESLNTPCYKIASLENIDIPLIRRVAKTGKPVIISTGLATLEELTETVTCVRDAGCQDLILLKCTTAYPAPVQSANLRTLEDLSNQFHCQVGLSDHTLGTAVAIAAVALGATVIEKHFTLNRGDGGVDSAFSLEPHEFGHLVHDAHLAWKALGEVSYGPTEAEINSLQYRRSLYAIEDIPAGTPLNENHFRAIRPGLGLAPKFYDALLGRKTKVSIAKGTPLSWDILEPS